MNTAVQQSLETLEAQVEAWQQQQQHGSKTPGSLERGNSRADNSSTQLGASAQSDAQADVAAILEPSTAQEDHRMCTPPPFPTPPPYSTRLPTSNWQPQPQSQAQSFQDTFDAPMLDLLPPIGTQPMAGPLLSSGTLIDPLFLFASNPPLQQLLDPNGLLLDLESGAGWGAPRPDLQDMF
jgi:hypothetical protein